MVNLPPFTDDGLLPPGDYALTIDELRQSYLVTGVGVDSAHWDSAWRSRLVHGLETLVSQLWAEGVREIFIDGSFVEAKDHPHDIDGYFECPFMEIATDRLPQALNARDPYRVWTWHWSSRRPDPNSTKQQLPMWHQYRVELYPHHPDAPWPCGIPDEFGHPQTFPAAFRKSRNDHRPRGIIKIIRGTPATRGVPDP